jgi:hypothetical protein
VSPWWTETLLHVEPAGADADRPGAGEDLFERAFDALAAQLALRAPPAGRRVRLVLRDDLLRWLVVGWDERCSDGPARDSALRQAFAAAYGEGARDWLVRADAPAWACPTLACALPQPQLARLQALLQSRRLKLAALTPLLAEVLADQPRAERRGDGWWVLRHDGGATLLYARRGQPVHLRLLPGLLPGLLPEPVQGRDQGLERGSAGALARALAREALALGIDDTGSCVRVIDAGTTAPDPATLPAHWPHRRWQRADMGPPATPPAMSAPVKADTPPTRYEVAA